MKRNFLRLFGTHKGWSFHWGGMEIVAASILSIAILSLGSGMFGNWIRAAKDGGLLPISLHSLVEADYSVDPLSRFVPAIGLDILRDLLGIGVPPETGEPFGIATNTPGAPSPTPTPTIFTSDDLPTQVNPTEFPSVSATPTQEFVATATQSPTLFYTPTATLFPTDIPGGLPTWTMSPPFATKTPKPPNIPTPSSTPMGSTPTATISVPTVTHTASVPTFTPTTKPTVESSPTAVPGPIITPTTRPTHSPTLAFTPTAQYTPGVTVGPPVLP